MLRTIGLIFQNEFRLLARDRVGIFMLLLAPVVIIAIAGFSLGDLYGLRPAGRAYFVPVVNQDRGPIARAVIGALRRESSLSVVEVSNMAQARALFVRRGHPPLVILIPAGTSAALAAGRDAHLTVYTDPVKRLEASAIELRLSAMCAAISAEAEIHARRRMAREDAAMRARFEHLAAQLKGLKTALENFRNQYQYRRAHASRAVQKQLRAHLSAADHEIRAAFLSAVAQANVSAQEQIAHRRSAMLEVERYLNALQASESEFDRWLTALRRAAGSHAVDIPAPPRFPAPPSSAQLAEIFRPLDLKVPKLPIVRPPRLELALPELPRFPRLTVPANLGLLSVPASPALPGNLTFRRIPLVTNHRVNAFDQYVPGFGVTFLLIGMLMGISLGLIDDRDWGTLQRLRVSGASFSGTLIGKLLARFVVGLAQMVILFAIGWLAFGVSLGVNPLMLVVVSAAIAFAAASFGLLIACIARTHDSVMPIGAVAAMAMSAIGGCWWPLDFEPPWMREVANWLPTTWTMQAYNDLMIRHMPAVSALRPSAFAVALGVAYLLIGIAGASRIYR